MANTLIQKVSSVFSSIKKLEHYFKLSDKKNEKLNALQQKMFMLQQAAASVDIKDYGFSIYSESDEDGLLLSIFSKIGFTNKKFVDVGGGSSLYGSNTANLILNHGFDGLIIEGEEENSKVLRRLYGNNETTLHCPPNIITKYVTIENVNQLLQENKIEGEIDLLSIDIDSIDYWVWNELTVATPRVIIVEFQCILNEDESISVPKSFDGTVFHQIGDRRYGIYNSASLKAFNKLAQTKGYRLVATSQLGFNAIFIKEDLAKDSIETISVAEGLNKPFTKWANDNLYTKTKSLEWVEV